MATVLCWSKRTKRVILLIVLKTTEKTAKMTKTTNTKKNMLLTWNDGQKRKKAKNAVSFIIFVVSSAKAESTKRQLVGRARMKEKMLFAVWMWAKWKTVKGQLAKGARVEPASFAVWRIRIECETDEQDEDEDEEERRRCQVEIEKSQLSKKKKKKNKLLKLGSAEKCFVCRYRVGRFKSVDVKGTTGKRTVFASCMSPSTSKNSFCWKSKWIKMISNDLWSFEIVILDLIKKQCETSLIGRGWMQR